MASQDQNIDGSKIENSDVQQAQAGRDAISFQNSHANQVTISNTINNIICRLVGQSASSSVDWDWAQRLLKDKQLPDIRQRLIDTLGRDRTLMQVSLDEQLAWVGRSPLQANRRLQVQGEDRGFLDWQKMLIETFGREDVGGKLLILGTPGAGKTTALLSLAEQLLHGALNEPKTVIPVIFELSTWRDGKRIEDWLIEQLYDLYGGDRKAKRYERWLEQQVLLPLMDGLDELGLERQKQCTLKLNEFARHYPQLVVCCRVKEFAQANVTLDNLRGSVCLEPLSDEQIQDYLNRIDRPRLWSTIQATPVLQALLEPDEDGDPGLLRVPLFITLAASVYAAQHPFQTREELLDQYVDRQLSLDVRQSDRRKETDRKQWEYKTPAQEPDRRQTLRTLQWIARQLQENNSVELLIERIQPNWLEKPQARRRYRLIVGLIVGLVVVPMVGLIVMRTGGLPEPEFGLYEQILRLIIVLMLMWVSVMQVVTSDIQSVEAFKILFSREERRKILKSLEGLLIIVLIGGLIGGLAGGLMFRLIGELMFGLIFGLVGGLIGGLIFVLIFVLIPELAFRSVIGLKKDLQQRSRPNQSIWNSLQSMLLISTLSYPFGIVFTFGTSELPRIVTAGVDQRDSLGTILDTLWAVFPPSLVTGLFFALLLGFCLGGGVTCVQHVCLRFVLRQSGIAPWNLARFLNYCVERRLLQRVGGRYRFLHRELLDHFAGQNTTI